MKQWLSDLWGWLFEQEGFSWREWRSLNSYDRFESESHA